MAYTVQRVARMAGVTERALRHYDRIGLLRPAGRSEAGYRLYGEKDLLRLQQILLFRELDFPLDRIRRILDDPEFDAAGALSAHIRYLKERAERYARLSRLAQDTLLHLKGEKNMKDEQLFEGFDYEKMMKEQETYKEEVKTRWGGTDAYRISKERTSRYKREDWETVLQAQNELYGKLSALFAAGAPAGDARVQELVRRTRDLINDRFYPCPKEMFAGLGELYASDGRFAAFFDRFAPGFAGYYGEAIRVYCAE